MVNVIFCGFGEGQDKRVFAKAGDVLLRVAQSNGINIPTDCKDGMCGSCAVRVEEISNDETIASTTEDYSSKGQAVYMDDKELETLVNMGAITKKEAEIAQQFNRPTPVRLACQCAVKNTSILVKPFN
ncbi:MAG: 2Fe-2S iron-sulfur cluster-binding protein [Sulfuricurvum sp.]|uniref:2Fe-2S iron-sulfur cluster-binding protein n=1 Tax=Sulfuricurvum sp. TaxID=2025608 RepID=UPI002630A9B4|nr:2Fe-2S iron-sulfur cluster binding domain-containing protein [Sulfuricurvum sp.]MDD2838082.1 2Fe-2S iron-sulfur cluster binding domain-containing protein [Sulfuricurvum sp.]MDD3596657.1 2Fe-2S iron-sulfur cluster binding domain-containing protein [Sulfuricurvum sp.]